MYIWRTSALADDLKENRLSEVGRLKYFLGTLLLATVLSAPWGTSPYWLEELFLQLFIIGGGTVYCFRVNEKGDNKDFIARVACLSWPLLIKVFLIGFVGAFLVAAVGTEIWQDAFYDSAYATTCELILGLSILVLFFARMSVHIDRISGSRKAS